MKGVINHNDLAHVEADHEQINKALIMSELEENLDVNENENRKMHGKFRSEEHSDVLRNYPNINNIHFSMDHWEDREEEEVIWINEKKMLIQ